MFTTILTAAVVVILGVALMCVFMLKPGGEFPKFDVGSNEQMHKIGIRCYKDEDAALHGKVNCDRSSAGEACKDCSFNK